MHLTTVEVRQSRQAAAEMGDAFALHISIVATGILWQEIGIALVLPKYLVQ
jgi:hypothetical protein